ncbi:MAG: hypothetical protein PHD68_10300 [Rugosibacter sp.]|nr:hypothetical protein [Rugosibacter sp.]
MPEANPLSEAELANLEAFMVALEAEIERFLKDFEPKMAGFLKELEKAADLKG